MKKATPGREHRSRDLTSRTRRSLVLGGIALPATPLIALLGGCGGDGSSTSSPVSSAVDAKLDTTIPMPPFAPAHSPAPALPPAQPLSAPVEHVPVVPPVEAGAPQVVMNVAVYNAEYDAFRQALPRRQVAMNAPGAVVVADPKDASVQRAFEDLHSYLKHTLDSKMALLNRAMLAAFAAHRPSEFDVSFFTAPEFFWNAPWSEFLSHAEIGDAADFYLDTVTKHVRALMARFPACKYGNIVLLCGTVAVLKPATVPKDKDGNPVYTASNHLVCTHNLPLDDPHHPRPAYMIWPKRVVSWIDFVNPYGSCTTEKKAVDPNPVNPTTGSPRFTCVLGKSNDLTVRIEDVSSDIAQSFDASGKLYSASFKNDIVRGLPFGIDICLDYQDASVQSNPYRMAELDDRRFKLDFVLAAGMKLSVEKYAKTPFIQYAVHNDGIQGSNENYRTLLILEAGHPSSSNIDVRQKLYSDIWALQYDKTEGKIYGDLVTPLDSASPFDVNGGVIAVATDDTFTPPADVDMTGMPPVADPLNAMQVRVWKLPVDVTDTGTYRSDIAALAATRCTT